VGLRAGLDDVEKRKLLPPLVLELRPLGRLARSQSLNRLRYACFLFLSNIFTNNYIIFKTLEISEYIAICIECKKGKVSWA
jgi:hypothetical protein